MTATAANEQPNPAPVAAPAQGATVLGFVLRILRKKWVWMPLLCLAIVGGLLWKFGPIVFAAPFILAWLMSGEIGSEKDDSDQDYLVTSLGVGLDPKANRRFPGMYAVWNDDLARQHKERNTR